MRRNPGMQAFLTLLSRLPREAGELARALVATGYSLEKAAVLLGVTPACARQRLHQMHLRLAGVVGLGGYVPREGKRPSVVPWGGSEELERLMAEER